MPRIDVIADGVSIDEPTMIEGLPGVGLVGKIATDHLVNTFEMEHYANVHCDGIPRVATYQKGEATLSTPVRLYADGERDLLALQSDIPISPQAAAEFADCFDEWSEGTDVTPVFLSGIPRQLDEDQIPSLYGVGVGEGTEALADADIDAPIETGFVAGPTGALLSLAVENERTAVGLIVEADPRFPDPEGARAIIKNGIEPLTGIEVPVDDLVDSAEEIRQAREQLAQRMQQADDESSRAEPIRMYQ